jgi:hypothetical protein
VTRVSAGTHFLLGRKDRFVPPETSVAYFDALTAPSKKLIWFEHCGHEPFVDEPDAFNTVMAELVEARSLGRWRVGDQRAGEVFLDSRRGQTLSLGVGADSGEERAPGDRPQV